MRSGSRNEREGDREGRGKEEGRSSKHNCEHIDTDRQTD